MDGDGDLDLVSHNSIPEILSFLNDGTGASFQVRVSSAGVNANDQFVDAALWDHDLDGTLDLATSRGNRRELGIFHGDGAGGFAYAAG